MDITLFLNFGPAHLPTVPQPLLTQVAAIGTLRVGHLRAQGPLDRGRGGVQRGGF